TTRRPLRRALARRADDRVLNHLQGNAPRCHRCLPASLENTQGFNHSVTASRRYGALAGEGRVRGALRIEIVVLATSAPIVLIRQRDLQNFDPGLLDEAKEAGSIAAVDSIPMRWTSPNDRIQASICRYPWRVVAKHRVPRA